MNISHYLKLLKSLVLNQKTKIVHGTIIPKVFAHEDSSPEYMFDESHRPTNILINPKVPLITPHLFSRVDSATLKKTNRAMTPEQYEEIYKEKISLAAFSKGDKYTVLQKIYNDMDFLVKALEPLKKLNIDVTVDLTGGAVRDFVLDKPGSIKDLDVMISYTYNRLYSLSTQDLFAAGFTNEELIKVDWQFSQEDVITARCKLIELCLTKYDCITNKYYHTHQTRVEPNENDAYGATVFQDRLEGVIKLSHPSLNYAMDLLITDLAKPSFLAKFDIDLCKASFCFVNNYYQKSFPKDPSHLVSRFVASSDFWADVMHKKLSIPIDERSKKMITGTIVRHLPKLQAKYPDYAVQFYCLYDTDTTKEVMSHVNAYLEAQTLAKAFPPLDTSALATSKHKI